MAHRNQNKNNSLGVENQTSVNSDFVLDLNKLKEEKNKTKTQNKNDQKLIWKKTLDLKKVITEAFNFKKTLLPEIKINFKLKIPKDNFWVREVARNFPTFSKADPSNLFTWPLIKILSRLLSGVLGFTVSILRIIYKFIQHVLLAHYKVLTHLIPKRNKKSKFRKQVLSTNFFKAHRKKKFRFPFFRKKKPDLIQDTLEEGEKINWNNLPFTSKHKHREPAINLWRSVLGFSLAVFLLILPFKVLSYYKVLDFENLKHDIVTSSKSGVENFLSASDLATQFKTKQASKKFSKASENFLQAQQDISKVNDFILKLSSLSKHPKAKLASESEAVVQAGINASKLGNELSLALGGIKNSETIKQGLDKFLTHSGKALEANEKLSTNLDNINIENLPSQYRDRFSKLKTKTKEAEKALTETISLAEGLKPFLGMEKDKRYLLVFQNNNEMRASGGFMGSYAIVDFRNGKIVNMEVPKGGTYDTEAGMDRLVEAPQPLQLLRNRWYMWDANWWPDWKRSAQNISWFYEHSGGSTVDGVISFTPTVMERMLEVVGPIEMEEYDLVLNEDNFWKEVQTIVEDNKSVVKATSSKEVPVKVKEDTDPKKIIGDMMEKLRNEVPERLNNKKIMELATSVEQSLAEKHILLYFRNEELQKKAEKKDWAGRIKSADQDYLMVVNSNIGGQKTDRKIDQTIHHTSNIKKDGSIINKVKIVRKHQGTKDQEFTGVRNVNWLRTYVPLGSELISASGFEAPDDKYFSPSPDYLKPRDMVKNTEGRAEIDYSNNKTKIYRENNKTVFANWTMLDPGETDVITFKYKLPFKLDLDYQEPKFEDKLGSLVSSKFPKTTSSYSLLVQKQPGSLHTDLKSEINFESKIDPIWYHPKTLKQDKNNFKLHKQLHQDAFLNLLLSQT